ncbi:MAG: hypothetical protein KKB25_02705 [Nanoarchaeota archaeon]|nr:hypothetical protein [Nanoarchaeota archaeon]
MKFSERKIVLDKEPNELDKLVFDFISLLRKRTDYAIVSGYVAIILGRIRGTDDVDVIIPKKTKEEFEEIINVMIGNGYWCINTDDVGEMYDLLKTGHSIRIAKDGEVSPNFEIKFAKSESDFEALEKSMEVFIKDNSVKIAPLELQIAYKEVVLKSEKDLEDAKHISVVAEKYIDKKLIDEYKERLRKWMQNRIKK